MEKLQFQESPKNIKDKVTYKSNQTDSYAKKQTNTKCHVPRDKGKKNHYYRAEYYTTKVECNCVLRFTDCAFCCNTSKYGVGSTFPQDFQAIKYLFINKYQDHQHKNYDY